MDISALLSPQDSPVRDAPSPIVKASSKKPRKPRIAKPTAAAKIGSSPLSRAYVPSEGPSQSEGGQARLAMPSPPVNGSSHPHPLSTSTTSTLSAEGLRPPRQSSTSGMDTLADLASMQHHQQTARTNAGGLRNSDVYDSQLPAATSLPGFHALTRKTSSSRSSYDIPMQDTQPQTPPPRTYTAPSLSQSESETIAQLVSYLAENPYAFDSHVQLVRLLHHGLIKHVYPSGTAKPENDPHSYGLLQDLHSATEAMDARFALGEDIWADRLQVQKLLATTLEDCIGVMEAFQRAVNEETGSTKLWQLYGDWMLLLYNMAHPTEQYSTQMDRTLAKSDSWSDEDKMVAAEVFSKNQVLDIWRHGVEDTKYRISDSHLIWDRYTELVLQDLAQSPSREGISSLKQHFINRLQVPHAQSEQTLQTFSTFVSTYDNALYEKTMVAAIKQGSNARQKYEAREFYEVKLQRAIIDSDKSTEWSVMTEKLEWERNQSRKQKVWSFDLVNALYQRAVLRFSTDTGLWEDYLMFLVDDAENQRHNVAILPLLERSCRHCPWSGTLWSLYLQEAERENRPFTDIGEIKHKATSTGLLDAGGMEEVLKVLTAWCGFLRRRAFQQDSTDEDLDVAEVGIRSAIEDMETLGRQKYETGYKGDPQYRLERIYIKYLSQSRNWQAARDTWKGLTGRHGDSYEFWLRYYNWEMITWGKHSPVDHRIPDEVPYEATKVLRQAVRRHLLDWPETIMDTFLHHCEDHESVTELQLAVNQTRKAMKAVTKRREIEALAAAELAQQQSSSIAVGGDVRSNSVSGKRKRDDAEGLSDESTSKKIRSDVVESNEPTSEEPPISTQSALKRDRENSTVIVKNLPSSTPEVRVRQYFRDCGKINSLKLVADEGGDTSTATIEFDSKEDVLTAQTKDMKTFDGNQIEVQVGTGSTLYITNFPPIADEAYIRDLFDKYGDVISVRLPSLKFNSRRRFCYVSFKSPNQAQAATELDGSLQEGDLKLYVKISDPGQRKARSGPAYDGRELHVVNIDWGATEADLSQVFSKYGTVESVRMPKGLGGKSKGFAFVVFSDKDEATAALDLDLTKFKSRLLHVSISIPDPAKRQATTTIRQTSTSASPAPGIATSSAAEPTPPTETTTTTTTEPPVVTNDTTSPKPTTIHPNPHRDEIASRTLALLHIPDTINETRIRALVSPFGALKKITMRLTHQGAIVEFADVASVGKAALALEGAEISEGRRISVGTVAQLMKEKGEVRRDRIAIGGGGRREGAVSLMQTSGVVRRPGGQGRMGKRGGLGLRRGVGGLGGVRAGDTEREGVAVNGTAGEGSKADVEIDRGDKGKAKSNADFKAMFLKG